LHGLAHDRQDLEVPMFDAELRECLEVILGSPPPAPEYEPFLFFKQWLGGRNLGLVPIANPRDFAWPGHWVARVRSGDGDHAVVMFGSPSGPLHDPSGAVASGGSIEEGWLLAPLDVRLPIEEPYGREGRVGSVAAVLTAAEAEDPLRRVETVEAIAGRGLLGDRYCDGRGTFSGPGRGYQLTLVEAEVLEAIGLPWELARRNVVTRGIALNGLVGHRFTIGAVECVGRRLAEPCAHLEKLARPGLLRPLVHRGGLRADILTGGSISVGDRVADADRLG
jgi:MOSC domain-containing protein YiiM